jgi:hypothetical protein
MRIKDDVFRLGAMMIELEPSRLLEKACEHLKDKPGSYGWALSVFASINLRSITPSALELLDKFVLLACCHGLGAPSLSEASSGALSEGLFYLWERMSAADVPMRSSVEAASPEVFRYGMAALARAAGLPEHLVCLLQGESTGQIDAQQFDDRLGQCLPAGSLPSPASATLSRLRALQRFRSSATDR